MIDKMCLDILRCPHKHLEPSDKIKVYNILAEYLHVDIVTIL